MNIGQYDGIMGRLGEILDAVKDRAPAEATEPAEPAPSMVSGQKPDSRRAALLAMLNHVDDWAEWAQGEHEALGHREKDCCGVFHPDDVRRMINGAAREIGLTEPIWTD